MIVSCVFDIFMTLCKLSADTRGQLLDWIGSLLGASYGIFYSLPPLGDCRDQGKVEDISISIVWRVFSLYFNRFRNEQFLFCHFLRQI